MPSILQDICLHKQREVRARKAQVQIGDLRARAEKMAPARGFQRALEERIKGGEPAIIAEIKRASPSKGILRKKFHPAEIAADYERAGAACLSVLTDEKYFQGADAFLQEAREACSLPVLRKDFLIDTYQVYEARALGADCVLLILSVLDDLQLQMLSRLATGMGMDVLLEVHNRLELERALQVDSRLIGINNRNLHTFEVSLDTTFNLLELIPPGYTVVTESGIAAREDVDLMLENGVLGFLVGEAFMRAKSPGDALQELFFPGRAG